MRWHRVADLIEYWAEWPPTHEILKLAYQVKKKPEAAAPPAPADPNDPSGIGGLLSQFPNGFVTGER